MGWDIGIWGIEIGTIMKGNSKPWEKVEGENSLRRRVRRKHSEGGRRGSGKGK